MVRVALVTHGFQTTGGVSSVAHELMLSLETSGSRVDVFDLASSMRDESSRRLFSANSWHLSPQLSRRNWGTHVGANLVELEPMRYRPRRLLDAELKRHDVVLAVVGSPVWLGPLRNIDIPIVVQVATRVNWERRSRIPAMPLHRRIIASVWTPYLAWREKEWIRTANVAVLENDDMLKWCLEMGVKSEHVAPGVDTNFFRPAQTRTSKKARLVSVGRLAEPRKGWHRLIEGFSAFHQRDGKDIRLAIVGRGALHPSVTDAARAAGVLDLIDVYSDVSREELAAILRESLVFVQTSFEEGLGIAALEAMASGVPVVATETSGSRQYVDSECGSLVSNSPFDPNEFADAISRVLSSEESMGMQARRVVTDRFSAEYSGAKFREILAQAIMRHRHGNA